MSRFPVLPPMVGAAMLSVGVLTVVPAPAAAAPEGTLIAEIAQPDGWRGMGNGSVVEYWTTGSDGSPRRASGALFLPAGRAPAEGWPIMVFEHGTSGLAAGCGRDDDIEHPGQEDPLVGAMVSRGFAVLAPDYLGLGRFGGGPHPFLETRTEADATIDLVRAVRRTHSELSRRWGVIGSSQGGHAALAAAHAAATAVPELDFRGVVAIDPASNVDRLLLPLGPDGPDMPDPVHRALMAMVLEAMRIARPDAEVDSYLTPLGRSVLDDIATMCSKQIVGRIGDLTLPELLSRPLSQGPFAAAVTAYLGVPTDGYRAPILLLLNVTDIVVFSPLHADLVAQLTANRVDFRTVVGAGMHAQLNSRMRQALDGFLATVAALR
ncbi:lipase family protein [Nocardia sp. CDC159]|uniref:Lipase family protein n=1 Tax=Nocardia pulmonis TaxID=2951408 RepID=A0A9X2EDJ6_9NOCA|nr:MULTISPECIES: lipase family protein [Nocardia]MCM6778932.1 lipase family protein [Nocardia pulmonis]MCM6791815.1 lipase family protein [Nocardia sp. CDC159]